jgi:hypothetical protein
VLTRGALNLVLYPLIMIVMGWGLSRWLQEWKDARLLVGSIAGAGLLFLVGTLYQLMVNRGAVMVGARLFSTTGNPQHAALVCAITLLPMCYLIIDKREWKIYRLLLGLAAGFQIILLLWTGSRTGLLVAVSGVVLLFRARIGKLALAGLLVGLSVWLAMSIYTESTLTIAGMFARGDTRTHAWIVWWQQFLDNMGWGIMTEQFGAGENSYLTTAAQMGLFGLIPLMLWMCLAGWQLLQLQRLRRYLGEEVLLADLATASLVSIAIGAIFEGYLLASLTLPIFAIYMYLALVTFLIDAVHVQQQVPAAHHPAMDDWEAEQLAAQYEYGGGGGSTPYETAVPGGGNGGGPRF